MKRSSSHNSCGVFAMRPMKRARNAVTQNEVTNDEIIAYIEKNGFGEKQPSLVSGLDPDVFRQHYYDKNELMDFCRETGISTLGLKEDLNKRIETYLRTGQVIVTKQRVHASKPDSQDGLKLSKKVVNYKSDPATRAFFEKHVSGFTGFSALVQKQIKQRLSDGDEFNYSDVIEMHKQFMADKKNGKLKKVAHESCEYNQFFMDYKSDVCVKPHSNKEAWMLVRNSAGPKTYQRYKDEIQKVMDTLSSEKVSTARRTPR